MRKKNLMCLACHPFGDDKFWISDICFVKTKQNTYPIFKICHYQINNDTKLKPFKIASKLNFSPSQYYLNIRDLKQRRETHCLQRERVLWTKYKYLDRSVTWWRQISFYLKLPVANWRRGNRKKVLLLLLHQSDLAYLCPTVYSL